MNWIFKSNNEVWLETWCIKSKILYLPEDRSIAWSSVLTAGTKLRFMCPPERSDITDTATHVKRSRAVAVLSALFGKSSSWRTILGFEIQPAFRSQSLWNLQSEIFSREKLISCLDVTRKWPQSVWQAFCPDISEHRRSQQGGKSSDCAAESMFQHLLQMTALLLSPCKCSRDSYVNICYHGNRAARLIRSTHTNEVWSLEMWSGESPICRRTQPEPWSPLCCFTGSDSTTIVSCLHILAHTLDTRWEQPKPEALPKTRQMQIINKLITC